MPHGVQTQATRHDRIALEMAGEKPQVGADVQLSYNLALVVGAAPFTHVLDAVYHKHVGQGQLGILGAEYLAMTHLDQLVPGKAALSLAQLKNP